MAFFGSTLSSSPVDCQSLAAMNFGSANRLSNGSKLRQQLVIGGKLWLEMRGGGR